MGNVNTNNKQSWEFLATERMKVSKARESTLSKAHGLHVADLPSINSYHPR